MSFSIEPGVGTGGGYSSPSTPITNLPSGPSAGAPISGVIKEFKDVQRILEDNETDAFNEAIDRQFSTWRVSTDKFGLLINDAGTKRTLNVLTQVETDSTLTGTGVTGDELGVDLNNPNTWTADQTFNGKVNLGDVTNGASNSDRWLQRNTTTGEIEYRTSTQLATDIGLYDYLPLSGGNMVGAISWDSRWQIDYNTGNSLGFRDLLGSYDIMRFLDTENIQMFRPLIGTSGSFSGNVTDNGNRVVTSVNTKLGPSITLVTDDIAEDASPVNLWYTDTRVQTFGDTRYLKLDGSNDPITGTINSKATIQIENGLNENFRYRVQGTWASEALFLDLAPDINEDRKWVFQSTSASDICIDLRNNGAGSFIFDVTGESKENGVRLVNYNRAINNGTGILGGGDLSTDRTLSVDTSVIATIAYVDSQTGNSTLDDVTTNGNTTANSISIGGLTASSGDFSGNVELDGILDTKRPAIEQVRVGYTRSQANTLGIYDNTTQKGGLQNRTADTAGATIPLRVFSNTGFDLLLDPGGKTVNDGDFVIKRPNTQADGIIRTGQFTNYISYSNNNIGSDYGYQINQLGDFSIYAPTSRSISLSVESGGSMSVVSTGVTIGQLKANATIPNISWSNVWSGVSSNSITTSKDSDGSVSFDGLITMTGSAGIPSTGQVLIQASGNALNLPLNTPFYLITPNTTLNTYLTQVCFIEYNGTDTRIRISGQITGGTGTLSSATLNFRGLQFKCETF